jgi:hypothetical protein
MFDNFLEQQRQVELAALEDIIFYGAPRVLTRDFQGEN